MITGLPMTKQEGFGRREDIGLGSRNVLSSGIILLWVKSTTLDDDHDLRLISALQT